MRHAFLIIAHNHWDQLRQLIKALDSNLCDFYIHVNSKIETPNVTNFSELTRKSKVYFTPRIPVTWGKYGICEASFVALDMAYRSGAEYDYYHLLTGSDIPLRPMREIDSFFEANIKTNSSGCKRTNYISVEKPNPKMESRVKYYNLFINHYRDKNRFVRKMATASNTLLCNIQKRIGIDRLKVSGVKLFCGSSWWSITHEFAGYYLEKSDWAKKQFGEATFAADEFVPQTVIMNSQFYDSCYEPVDGIHKNLRLLNFDGGNGYGSPKVWTIDDKESILLSKDIFARKFEQDVDNEIIEYLLSRIGGDE